MPAIVQRPKNDLKSNSVRPSPVSADGAGWFSPDQEFETFGKWVGDPKWVPPEKASDKMAESMLRRFGALASKKRCWEAVEEEHRSSFTQVREIEMSKASIRLPKGKLFVEVTERDHFDTITDEIPNCVQTRLDEFLDGPGKRPGVRVYYLKPLCVESGDDLIFTTGDDVDAAIEKIQSEVFSAYRRNYLYRRPQHFAAQCMDDLLRAPRAMMDFVVQRRQRAIDKYQARLEFKRRKIAMKAAETHKKFRSHGCTYDEMLALTNPLERTDVVNQYSTEKKLSNATRNRLIKTALNGVPWFVTLSIGFSYLSTISLAVAPPLVVCDPAFVAEMPGAKGELLRIGHFDEVAGVTHVEI